NTTHTRACAPPPPCRAGLGLGHLGNVGLWPTKDILFGENTYEAFSTFL
ncbi:hypothetical protein ISN45_Aa04g007190, partial [Arabidopsis thaliana x Arabidopsis arenosa]